MLRWLMILVVCASLVHGVDHFVLHDRLAQAMTVRAAPVMAWVRTALHLPAASSADQAAGKAPATSSASPPASSDTGGASAATALKKETVSPEQLASTKEQLRQEIQAVANIHTIHLANGKVISGNVEAEVGGYVTVRQQLGSSGWFSRKFRRGQVLRVEVSSTEQQEITDEDALMKIEFPTFHMVKEGAMSFFSDQDTLMIKDLMDMLTRLREQLRSAFGELIEHQSLKPSYAVVFSTEGMYRHYIQGMPSHLQNSAGVFIPAIDRLVIFNFFGSRDYMIVDRGREMIGRGLEERRTAVDQSGLKGQSATRHYVEQIDEARQMVGSVGARVGLAAKSLNFMVIRHEGTHQFFHAMGLDAKPLGRQLWLQEGLATYAETASVGERNNEERLPFVKDLVQRHAHRQLRDLIQSDDLFTGGDMAHALAGYAESWSLVYYVMRSPLHDRFIHYLQAILATASDEKQASTSAERLAFFEQQMGITVTQLEADWAKFIQAL